MDNWPAHEATAHIERINARLAAGWQPDHQGIWHSPDGVALETWIDEGWPLPEDPEFADWFEAAYHYEAADAEQDANPYPLAPGLNKPGQPLA